jgi:hypothetical protein
MGIFWVFFGIFFGIILSKMSSLWGEIQQISYITKLKRKKEKEKEKKLEFLNA